jgi:hypothetical protein
LIYIFNAAKEKLEIVNVRGFAAPPVQSSAERGED